MPIMVNNIEITDDEVHSEMQYHPAESLDAARHKAAQALVIRQLLMQEAIEQNLHDDTQEIEESIDRLIQKQVSVPQADEATCRRYYEQNKQRFIDKVTKKQLPFASVSTHIQTYLQARSLKTGISQYIKLLAGRAKIAGFDIEASDSPLVQ